MGRLSDFHEPANVLASHDKDADLSSCTRKTTVLATRKPEKEPSYAEMIVVARDTRS